MITAKRGAIVIALSAVIFLAGCYGPTGAERGGRAGAGVGAITGALLDSQNPWRGGLIGAALGAVFGATLGDISDRASYESAKNDAPVEYRTEDGRGRYRADPEGYDPDTRCRRIHERVYEDGYLVRDRVIKICEKDLRERRY
jgi:hypothetical protein